MFIVYRNVGVEVLDRKQLVRGVVTIMSVTNLPNGDSEYNQV